MKTFALVTALLGLLACAHWIGAKISEPVQPTMSAETASAPPLPPLEPVATSFAKFEAANLRAVATSTSTTSAMISRFDCGPDPRKCVGTLTIPVGCIRSCEGQTLHLKRPDFAGYAGECTIHGQTCVSALDTPFISPNDRYLKFIYRNDSGDLNGAFEIWPQEIR